MSYIQSKPTVFVSYNHSQKDFADEIVQKISYAANIVIDKKLSPWGNLTEFMESIREQDFAVLLISEAYLKSQNCMFEVSQLVRDKNWLNKVMFIVFEDANVYDICGQGEYIEYWQLKRNELEEQFSRTPKQSAEGLVFAMREIDEIQLSISTILTAIKTLKNPPVKDGISAILQRITVRSFDDCDNINILLHRAIDELSNITEADYNQIILSAKTSSHNVGLIVFADKISGDKQKYRLVEQSGLIANCYATGKRLNCMNVQKSNDYFIAVVETASELVIPISFDSKTIGVFNSESEVLDFYTDEKITKIEYMLTAFSKRLMDLGYRSNCDYRELPYISI